MMSGDIISLEGDLEEVRLKIKNMYYPNYPLRLIKLLEVENEMENEEKIDRFLFVDDLIELGVNVSKNLILDTGGRGYEFIELVKIRNGKEEGVVSSIYKCRNGDNYSDSFVLSSDVNVISIGEKCTIIKTPTTYKTLSKIINDIDISL